MWKLLFPVSFSRYAILFLWLVIILAALLWLVIGVTRHWGVSEQAADWAQAAGSLAAVFTALYAVFDQRSSERRARDERAAVVIRSVQITAQRAYEAVLILHFAIHPSPIFGQMPEPGRIEATNNALAAIKSIDPMTLPAVELIDPVVTLGRCLESLLQIYEGKQLDEEGRSALLVDLASAALEAIKSH